MMDTIFTVKNDDLERLSPEEAVDLFRELLWAEATALGLGKNLINVPTAITVADGGIDAEVRDAQVVGGQGIIKQGLTRYQIKTGDFSPSNEANVKVSFSGRARMSLSLESSPVWTGMGHWFSFSLVGTIQSTKMNNTSVSSERNWFL